MTWWQYLLLVNVYLILFFGFYALLLRRETFFQLNRIYLVGAALFSFLIPGIQADWVKDLFITQQVKQTIYSSYSAPVNITAFAPIKNNFLTIGELLIMLYICGVIFLAVRLMWQLILLRRVITQDQQKTSFSFFKKIRVDEAATGKDIILAHEKVHAQQWHSVDVLIIEAVMIINWFNPVVYLYRFAIKHIHEYIADRNALKEGTSKAEYALLLLSQSFNSPTHELVTPFFNHSLLKQRIMMLQKDKSARVKLLKYGLSAPLFLLMLILSSATINNSDAIKAINKNANRVFQKSASSIIPDEKPSVKRYDFTLEPIEKKADKKAAIADTVPVGKNIIFTAVEKQPRFPGGIKGFERYLSKAIKYPADARDNNIQGRVILTFVIEKDGSLSDIKVIRGIGYGADEEAVRAMKNGPKWIPGKQNGKSVRVQYTVPVSFALTDDTVGDNKPETAQPNKVFTAVEVLPSFPGGEAAFYDYLHKALKYPAKARENKTEGRVIATFVIQKDGSIRDIKIVRGIGDGADEEAVRVLKGMPKWNPGVQNGRAVAVQYSVPISFALNDVTPDPNKGGKVGFKSADSTYRSKNLLTNSDGTHPLIIVDGKERTGLDDLNPKDINSISVLKDKNAILEYGDKAFNGVIVIETKKAKAAKANKKLLNN
ncbi:M56 family metallopeptidase [Mucilaginibacter segetis]|uniref:TonB family protein n=1 Tax=Mucilaginibacter segetis TaxID=2793071 RepID=A0A934PQT8_9SPHI|nr:M56 family metallopeptidase [Mucilaginibacter segetis]MBK0377972.1 TonB family protein [Mucilaginibacter segetis]